MFNWKKNPRESSTPEIERQIHEMFETLETGSFRGPVQDAETLERINQTIALATNLLRLIKENPDIPSCPSLTRTYLGSALYQRIQYYKQEVITTTGYSFYLVQKLADEVKSRQPKAKEYLQNMLSDLDCLLSDEMKEDVGLKELMLEWRCMCFRALSDYRNAIQDAKQILRQDDKGYKSYILLSECYWDFRDFLNAIEAATRAIEHCANNLQRYHALNHRSQIYHEAGNKTDAERDRLHARSFEVEAKAIVERLTGR